MKVLVTGASGFVGAAVVRALSAEGVDVTEMVRRPNSAASDGRRPRAVDLASGQDLAPAVEGMDAVVHLAAVAHVRSGSAQDRQTAYRRVNADGAAKLAEASARAGVRRFLFVSSIGVNGDRTQAQSFSEDVPPKPHSLYAQSKLEAEVALTEVSRRSGLDLVIVRPPLIVGPRAPGSLQTLLRIVDRGIPLPLGGVDNRRSLLGLESLIDFVRLGLSHPAAVGQTFLLADKPALSTPVLLTSLARLMGRPSRLVAVPTRFLRVSAGLLGRAEAYSSLWNSLEITSEKAEDLLGWRSRNIHGSLEATVSAYLADRG